MINSVRHLNSTIRDAQYDPERSLENIAQIESSFSILRLLGKSPIDVCSYLTSCADSVIASDGRPYRHPLTTLVSKYPWKLLGSDDTANFLVSYNLIKSDLPGPLNLNSYLLCIKWLIQFYTLKAGICPNMFIAICMITTLLSKDLDTILSFYHDYIAGENPDRGRNFKKILGFFKYITKVQESGGGVHPIELAYQIQNTRVKWTKINPDNPEVVEYRELADSITPDSPQVLELQDQLNSMTNRLRGFGKLGF